MIIYSARKWCRLALAGNPTVLLPLLVPDEEVMFRNEAGAELVSNAHRVVSGSRPIDSSATSRRNAPPWQERSVRPTNSDSPRLLPIVAG